MHCKCVFNEFKCVIYVHYVLLCIVETGFIESVIKFYSPQNTGYSEQ